MSEFSVDPVIQKLTHALADWPLSRVFLYNDSRYQWGLLVPRRAGVTPRRQVQPSSETRQDPPVPNV